MDNLVIKKVSTLGVGLIFTLLSLAACSRNTYSLGDKVYTIPGQTVTFGIVMENCISGNWATRDLKFTLYAPDGEIFFTKEEQREQNWGNSLSGEMQAARFVVEVPVPADQPVPSLISGTLIGTITCPQGGGHSGFSNFREDVDHKVELYITTAEEISQKFKWQIFWENLSNGFGFLCGGLVFLGLIVGLIYSIKEWWKKRQG